MTRDEAILGGGPWKAAASPIACEMASPVHALPRGQAWTVTGGQTVGMVPPSITSSAPWMEAARSEAR